MSDWHKSSYSPNGSNCVETREYETGADVRDTKHPEQGHLSFDRSEWTALLATM